MPVFPFLVLAVDLLEEVIAIQYLGPVEWVLKEEVRKLGIPIWYIQE